MKHRGQIFIIEYYVVPSYKDSMARPLRIQYENACCHVTCRGNAREIIFTDDTDREKYLTPLARSSEIYQVEVK